MSKCNYVRKNCSGWEYGHIEIIDSGTKLEKRKYVAAGHAPSYEEACHQNLMATQGQPKVRPHIEKHNPERTWN